MVLVTFVCTVCLAAIFTILDALVIAAKVANSLLHDPYQKIPWSTRPRIVDGVEAKPFEFPWLVEIRQNGEHICGGSILNTHYVLTAAHCVHREHIDYLVVVGAEHNMRCREGTEVARNVVSVTIHENFNPVTKWNDIAILRVHPPWVYTNFMAPVLLPPYNLIYPAKAMVAGWGILHYVPSHRWEYVVTPDKLRKVELPYISDTDCLNQYSNSSHVNQSINLCYGAGGDRDACTGDSGGALMCKDVQGRNVICGIVSWGERCAIKHKPSVFVKVPSFLDWIKLHSNISHPAPPILKDCSGYLNATQGFFNFTNLAARSLCTWTIESYYEEKSFALVSSALLPGDEIWFTNVSHVCEGCKPVQIDLSSPTSTYNFSGSSIIIMIIRLAHPTTLLQIQFKSGGDRAVRYPVTDLYTYRASSGFIKYPVPPKGSSDKHYYYNSQNVLFVLTPGVPDIEIIFIFKDIKNDGGTNSCLGDHLAVFHLSLTGEYKLLEKYCGPDIPAPLQIKIEGPVILQFVSTPNSKFGEGFRIRYIN